MKQEIKKGYIIGKVSGWYWGAYTNMSNEKNRIKHGESYVVFDTREQAEICIPDALKEMCGQHLTIHEIFYEKRRGQ